MEGSFRRSGTEGGGGSTGAGTAPEAGSGAGGPRAGVERSSSGYESSPGVHRNRCRLCGSRVPSLSREGDHDFVHHLLPQERGEVLQVADEVASRPVEVLHPGPIVVCEAQVTAADDPIPIFDDQ